VCVCMCVCMWRREAIIDELLELLSGVGVVGEVFGVDVGSADRFLLDT